MKNAPLKGLLALVIGLILSIPSFAQFTAKEEKAIQKSKDLYLKGDEYNQSGNYSKAVSYFSKAVETIKKVQQSHSYSEDLWQLRCLYEYDRYDAQFYQDIYVLLKKLGKGSTNVKFKSTEYYNELLVACSEATLLCGKQELASQFLHEKLIAPSTDTAISDEASELYSKGGDDYNAKNYSDAIRSYEKALKMDSTYYKATYKIAMCYLNDEKYDRAIPYFEKAVRLQPEMLEPRQHLVDCYMKQKQWQDAYNAAVDGIVHYPDVRYFTKLEDIADNLGKTFSRHWMSRDYSPNMMSSSTQAPITEEPWSYYREAKDKISDYCNEDGVIKRSQSLTDQKYMEAYSWEYMLKKSDTDKDEFKFARKMLDAGYIDCYAMVSMFHITFLKQYQEFSKKNSDRIKKYVELYLMK